MTDPSPNQNPSHRGGSGRKSSYRLGMSVLRLDDVLAEVMERTADNGIRIVGVDGPQGSGKSTLAARIAARSGAPLVQMDDFVSWVDLVGCLLYTSTLPTN